MKHFLSLIVALVLFAGASAQDYIDRDFSIKKSINFASIDGEALKADPHEDVVSITVQHFPNGSNTVYVKYTNNNKPILEFAYSGKSIHLAKGVDSGNTIYVVMDENRQEVPVALALNSNKNEVMFVFESKMAENRRISGSTLGQKRSEFIKSSGLSLKYSKQSGNYKVYVVDGPDLQKRYHWDGDYHYEAKTKAYAEFYFDGNDKLAKFCFVE